MWTDSEKIVEASEMQFGVGLYAEVACLESRSLDYCETVLGWMLWRGDTL